MTLNVLSTSTPALGLTLTTTDLVLGIIAVILAVIAIVLILRHAPPTPAPSGTHSVPTPESSSASPPVGTESAPPSQPGSKNGFVQPDDPTEEASAPVPLSTRGRIATRAQAEQAEAEGDHSRAADLWRLQGDHLRECEALSRTDQHLRRSRLLLALGMTEQAFNALGQSLQQNPEDNDSRLLLAFASLDLGKYQHARDLATPIFSAAQPDVPAIIQLGRAFEAVHQFDEAARFYQNAVEHAPDMSDASVRLDYLRQLNRVARLDSQRKDSKAVARLMRKALEDTQAGPEMELEEEVVEGDGLLEPYDVVVGHLALGGTASEPWRSVRSRVSSSARFEYKRLVGEGSSSAVFEAVDRLLDCPVAIRLSRIPSNTEDFEHLSRRLVAIAQLNHPNLSKVAYVDRFGNVARVVSEFHSGGNLIAMLAKIHTLGIPMMLRLLMQVASGLGTAHRHGILHGDLRPENIMLAHDNLIKIVDFSLQSWPVRAKGLDDTVNVKRLSQAENQELQGDISQFADLIEFLLERATVFDPAKIRLSGYDPVEELREVIARARGGSFSTIKHVHRILGEILNRLVPGSLQ